MRQIYNFFSAWQKKETDYYFYCIIWLIIIVQFGQLLLCQLAKFHYVSWLASWPLLDAERI